MKNNTIFKITFWKVIATVIIVIGLYAIYLRFTQGIGAVSNLSDEFPWGLWIGFDILSGVGLAAGGFTLCAIVYIFNIEKYRPIIRPTILTAFLGYLLVIFALMIDLGRPWAIWHAIIMWNPRSVMFEVAWCVILYSTVLFLEFSPIVLEKYKLKRLLKVVKVITIPLVIMGVILSTLHQSSLGSLYLITPSKMHPLWYSSLLPVFFYLSAIAVGCAMIIMESYLSAKAYKKQLEFSLLVNVGKWMVVVLGMYGAWRFTYLIQSGKIGLLFQPSEAMYLFHLEILIGIIVPISLLLFKKIRENRVGLFIASITVIGGFLLNRLNVSVTAFQASAGTYYFPSFLEISLTLFIIVIGVIVFNFVIKNFNVFEDIVEPEPVELKEVKPKYAVLNDLNALEQN